MAKRKVHRVPATHRVPTTVPDKNRPLRDPGPNPGGLPPRPIPSAWKVTSGHGVRLHTHS
jgi:hypothetical protein